MHALEPVLIAAVIVFVLNAAGSFIEFNNRFVNALVDTVLRHRLRPTAAFWPSAHEV